ncbi:unnamed protein product [Leptidea sinapis]|uniref:Kazal-like domain-containing protein n=1 Tax=Leptidea sinapis TaxID=189913 RepID=A0A5E4QTX6_9NEOP|nr:unnamed protein product [Leptidea sinapis]
MKLYLILFPIVTRVISDDLEKIKYCADLSCTEYGSGKVCGVREDERGVRLKIFKNECELLKYGCSVDESDAFGLISMKHCLQNADNITDGDEFNINKLNIRSNVYNVYNNCEENCNNNENNEVCGITEDGEGYRVRLFYNKCELDKYNCNNINFFTQTDHFICSPTNHTNNLNDSTKKYNEIIDGYDDDIVQQIAKFKNLVVVKSGFLNGNNNVNDTIDNFFAATHVFDLPVEEVNAPERRMLIKHAGPIHVFKPWIEIPKKKYNDTIHRPTLSTCYHKCPFKCPDTYAPVCGVPGIVAREPSLMFQNHCFMDVAQSYIESSFLFCLGDAMNAMFRFLPAIRTLQRMGRLKKKGVFHAKINNFRFFSNHGFGAGRPKFMG